MFDAAITFAAQRPSARILAAKRAAVLALADQPTGSRVCVTADDGSAFYWRKGSRFPVRIREAEFVAATH